MRTKVGRNMKLMLKMTLINPKWLEKSDKQ